MTATHEWASPVLVVGGGLGGVAAALVLCELGVNVTLTEDGAWLGGQLTSQAVPPDEHPWVESRYASPRYRRLRSLMRDEYRATRALTQAARTDPLLNPGLGDVSGLCAPPSVNVRAVETILAPHVATGTLRIVRDARPVTADRHADTIRAVEFTLADGDRLVVAADVVLDATETGDLLALAGAEYTVGAESAAETGEPHAPDEPNPDDQQAITWCFAVEDRAGEDHTIAKPRDYETWRDRRWSFWPGSQLSWTDLDPIRLRPRTIRLHEPGLRRDRWTYRRIVARSLLADSSTEQDVSLVNWPQNDCWTRPLVDPTDTASAQPWYENDAARDAKALSRAFLYWMQTEAPRADGGTGHPGLLLRPDLMGTTDGFAQRPYVRESRRALTLRTVTELDVGVEASPGGSTVFDDAVGIGAYRIDLHPTPAGRSYVDVDCYPFQIPLRALVCRTVTNLVPAAKCIGTTHISNGALRLHPVEWSAGEAAAILAAQLVRHRITSQDAATSRAHVADIQQVLRDTLGSTLAWPEDIRTVPCPADVAVPRLVEPL